jgi:DNA topoisomerase-3
METGKILLLCEKPSVARDFVKALEPFEKFRSFEGFFEGSRYIVSWAYGHLCDLKEPEDYNQALKKWNLETLPIIPQRFEYKVLKQGAKQFKIIKELLQRVDSVYICTDCGREGELIARLILFQAGWKDWSKVYRFWTSEALTPEVIRKTLLKVRPAVEFDRLFKSALARQWADWLVGINCTRAVSCKYGDLFTVGRVQTAVLSLIVEREAEIRNFKPTPYYNVQGSFAQREKKVSGLYFEKKKHEKTEREEDEEDEENEDEEEKKEGLHSRFAIREKEVAERIADAIKGKVAIVKKVRSKIVSEKPPLLFSLTTLQQEANRLFGFSAAKTLEICQNLYEKHHLLSYPRTESQHLDPAQVKECMQLLKELSQVFRFDLRKCTVDAGNKRVFDLAKLTDHHALIPQGVPKSHLTEDEKKIYELVCKRFIAAFYPDCKYRKTEVEFEVEGYGFLARGNVLVDAGWREIYGGLKSDVLLPLLRERERFKVVDAKVVKKQTQPPPRYTDASILEVMAKAYKVIKDEGLRHVLKEAAGLGTPATRAEILRKLQEKRYVVKNGKYLVPTPKAEFLVKMLQGEKVADVSYTAIWERELERIAKGEVASVSHFLEDVKRYVVEFLERIKKSDAVYQKKEEKGYYYVKVKKRRQKRKGGRKNDKR